MNCTKILIAGLLAISLQTGAEVAYDIHTLSTSNYDVRFRISLNESGMVAGGNISVDELTGHSKTDGFLYVPGTGLQLLEDHFMPIDLNLAGVMIGEETDAYLPEKGVIHLNQDPALTTNFSRHSSLRSVNDSGLAVGWVRRNGNSEMRTFVYDLAKEFKAPGAFSMLDTIQNEFGEAADMMPVKINNLGQIIGELDYDSAFFYDPDLGLTDLTRLNPFKRMDAVDLNANGVMTGNCLEDRHPHAFIYSQTDGLQWVGALSKTGKYSEAVAINDRSEVVGCAKVGGFSKAEHAIFWSKETGIIDLGALTGSNSKALAINNQSQVVGCYAKSKSPQRAFIWSKQTGMRDLTQLIPANTGWDHLESASGINDAGDIIGIGILKDGTWGYFLLTPKKVLRQI